MRKEVEELRVKCGRLEEDNFELNTDKIEMSDKNRTLENKLHAVCDLNIFYQW